MVKGSKQEAGRRRRVRNRGLRRKEKFWERRRLKAKRWTWEEGGERRVLNSCLFPSAAWQASSANEDFRADRLSNAAGDQRPRERPREENKEAGGQ